MQQARNTKDFWMKKETCRSEPADFRKESSIVSEKSPPETERTFIELKKKCKE